MSAKHEREKRRREKEVTRRRRGLVSLDAVRKATTLAEAMRLAIRSLGGTATVEQTRDFIAKHFGARAWSPRSVGRRYWELARAPQFHRVTRGTYELARASHVAAPTTAKRGAA